MLVDFSSFLLSDRNYQWIFSGAAFAFLSFLFAAVRWAYSRWWPALGQTPTADDVLELRRAKADIGKIASDARAAVTGSQISTYSEAIEFVKNQNPPFHARLEPIVRNIERKNLVVRAYSQELRKMVAWNERMHDVIATRCNGRRQPRYVLRTYANVWAWYHEKISYVIDFAINTPPFRSRRVWSLQAKPSPRLSKLARQDVQAYLDALMARGGGAQFVPRLDRALKVA